MITDSTDRDHPPATLGFGSTIALCPHEEDRERWRRNECLCERFDRFATQVGRPAEPPGSRSEPGRQPRRGGVRRGPGEGLRPDVGLGRRAPRRGVGTDALRPARWEVEGDRPEPDLVGLHQELRRPGVTLELLHVEYLAQHPTGYRYSAFCERYRFWRARQRLSMGQVHKAGERAFVDYAGMRPALVDAVKGEVTPVELSVAVLGASKYTFAVATRTQQSADWIASHSDAVEAMRSSTLAAVRPNRKLAIRQSIFASFPYYAVVCERQHSRTDLTDCRLSEHSKRGVPVHGSGRTAEADIGAARQPRHGSGR